MLKNIEWIENDVYSIKLKENMYTLVQMRKNYIMQFFETTNFSDNWEIVDLDKNATIFFKIVALKGLKKIFSQKIPTSIAQPSSVPIETKVLSMDLTQAPNYSAKLLELTKEFDIVGAKKLTDRLDINNDLDIIYRYELAGSEGSAEKIANRLIRYFNTGINWDDSKEFLFKGITPPPPYYGKLK